MWGRTRTGWVTGCISAILLASTGCTISIQPWTRVTTNPQPAPVGVTDPSTGGFVPYGFQGPMPKPMPPVGGPLSFHGPNNEAIAQMVKQANEAEDLRRALNDQVNNLNKQLRERDEKLRLASHEIEESSTKLRKTREEFRQWESEMTEMRERVRKLEDNRRSVGLLIEEILQHLDRPREPVRLPSMDKSLKRD